MLLILTVFLDYVLVKDTVQRQSKITVCHKLSHNCLVDPNPISNNCSDLYMLLTVGHNHAAMGLASLMVLQYH